MESQTQQMTAAKRIEAADLLNSANQLMMTELLKVNQTLLTEVRKLRDDLARLQAFNPTVFDPTRFEVIAGSNSDLEDFDVMDDECDDDDGQSGSDSASTTSTDDGQPRSTPKKPKQLVLPYTPHVDLDKWLHKQSANQQQLSTIKLDMDKWLHTAARTTMTIGTNVNSEQLPRQSQEVDLEPHPLIKTIINLGSANNAQTSA